MSLTKSSFCVSKVSFLRDALTKIIILSLHTESQVLSMNRAGPIYACAQGFLSLAQGSRKARARLDKSAQEGDICDRCVHYRTPKLHFWRMSLTKSSFWASEASFLALRCRSERHASTLTVKTHIKVSVMRNAVSRKDPAQGSAQGRARKL